VLQNSGEIIMTTATIVDVTSKDFHKAAQSIFKKCFKNYTSASNVDKSVWLASEDPGQWAKNSILVVHKESGIPDKYYYPQSHSNWEKAESMLSSLIGREVFFEEINGAVSALYWA
jgi:hypothetical protein